MTQAWNPAQTCASIALSGANLIGTMTSLNAPNNASMFAATTAPGRRIYWEVLLSGGTSIGAGIGNNVSAGIVIGTWVGSATNTLGWYEAGGLWSGGVQVDTWATWASGATLCFSMDLISNLLFGRVGAAGNWNNGAIGSQNPAVGSQVGGTAIPSAVRTSGDAVPGVNLFALSDVATGKFDQASWIGTPPAGFSAIDQAAVQAWRRAPVSQFLR